ncbi:AAA family ATPase [Spongiactinospora rosea]|uniref:AAA family ATPase n=1 Tax=Spongiactinospora rosea TaxID=2248750 RepID=UPI001313F3FC|nr:ATP-binding protein [Spongiactinospora rosea]
MSTRVVSPRFVGRSGELAGLTRALGLAREGSASTMLVGGEAGVGKTRLIREFAARAGGDVRVLVGGCLELGHDGLPFAPFAAVLRTLTRDLGREAIAALLPGGSARGLARLLPEFGEPDDDGPQARARLSSTSSACSTGSPSASRPCWSSKTRTGPTAPPATCSPSWFATSPPTPAC